EPDGFFQLMDSRLFELDSLLFELLGVCRRLRVAAALGLRIAAFRFTIITSAQQQTAKIIVRPWRDRFQLYGLSQVSLGAVKVFFLLVGKAEIAMNVGCP